MVVPSLVKIICIVVDIDIFIGQSSVQGPVSGHLIMLWRERERERESPYNSSYYGHFVGSLSD